MRGTSVTPMLQMEWHQLLFAHWRVPSAAVMPFLPRGCVLDTFDGDAWLGVIPFRMRRTGLRAFGFSVGNFDFLELNVRTYVRFNSTPGVLFLSLDATSRLAVWGARRFFFLPYLNATMRCDVSEGRITYEANRTDRRAPPAELRCVYSPTGAEFRSESHSLEEWLTERYFLFTSAPDGTAMAGRVYHDRWKLRRARVDFEALSMTRLAGIELATNPEHVVYADSLAVTASRLITAQNAIERHQSGEMAGW